MARSAQKTSSVKQATQQEGRSQTISGSVERSVALRLGRFLKRTHWQQSRVISDALCLYTEIPPVTLQRMRELEDRLGETQTREVVAAAIESAVDHLEWGILAQATAQELDGRFPEDITEPQLVTHANDAIAASRAARRHVGPPGAALVTPDVTPETAV